MLGAVVELVLIRPVEKRPPLDAVVVTFGLLVLLQGLAGMFFGGTPRSYPPAFSIVGYEVGGRRLLFAPNDLWTVLVVFAGMVLLAVIFRWTSLGLRMRAAAFAPEVSRLLGVRVGHMLTIGWALAAGFGALAGVLIAPSTFVSPTAFDAALVFGFTAAVIGGLDSPPGALVGGLSLGVALSYVSGYIGSDVVALGALVVLDRRAHGASARPVRDCRRAAGMSATAVAAPRIGTWPRSTLLRHLMWSVLGMLGLYLLSNALSPFHDLQLAQICYTATAAAGLTVLSGLSGQISLGHGAFMAIGAYSTALLLLHQHWKLGIVLIVSTAITAAAGVLVGVAAARLRGPYLAGATLALAIGLPSLANYHRLRESLGGANGLSVVGRSAAVVARRDVPARAVAGLDLRAVPGHHLVPAGESRAEPDRARHAPHPRGRGRGGPVGGSRRPNAGVHVQHQRRLRGTRRRPAGVREQPGRAGGVPAGAVALAAHRGGARRTRQPGRSCVRLGHRDAAAHVGHGHCPVGSSVSFHLRERATRRIWRGAYRGDDPLPRRAARGRLTGRPAAARHDSWTTFPNHSREVTVLSTVRKPNAVLVGGAG